MLLCPPAGIPQIPGRIVQFSQEFSVNKKTGDAGDGVLMLPAFTIIKNILKERSDAITMIVS